MIEMVDLTLTYPGARQPVLREVNLAVDPGELLLVVGGTGSGKSTLLRAITGAFPHSTGGHLHGQVRVAGRDTREHRPRDLADVVGVVGQDPEASFVTGTVEAELAYTLEQLGLPPSVMRTRVEATLDQLGLAPVRERLLETLSGGEQQRVAIGAVLTAHPQVLVLDEPTSALDPAAAEEVLAALHRLVQDLGITVVLAEHRIERVAGLVDRVALVADGAVRVGAPGAILADYSGAPPVVGLGRLAGWSPPPVTVREARRLAGPLAHRLGSGGAAAPREPGERLLSAREVTVRHGAVSALERVSLDLHAGEVTVLMGRNGAGKSSLLWALQGSGKRSGGTVRLGDGSDPARLSAERVRGLVTLLPQPAADLLYLPDVAAELAAADGGSGRARAELDALVSGVPDETDPRELSEGQRLAVALAVQLAADAAVLLLDEPTRGLDAEAKGALARRLRELADQGRAVVVTTHDVEFAASCADRVAVLAGGELVADGPAVQVLRATPMLAPQIAKVLPEAGVLTVADVAARLESPDG